MSEFPNIYWVEIDGETVPFTKPQHYKKGSTTETDLTGHDNPLPTADYGMTDSGVWIPKKVSDEGAQHTQLTGSYVDDIKPVEFILNQDVEVQVGSTYFLSGNLDYTELGGISDMREYSHFSAGIQTSELTDGGDIALEVRNKAINTGGTIAEWFYGDHVGSSDQISIISKTPFTMHNTSFRVSHTQDEPLLFRDLILTVWKI